MRDLFNMQNLEIRSLKDETKSLLTVIRILSGDTNNISTNTANPPIVLDEVTTNQVQANNYSQAANCNNYPKQQRTRKTRKRTKPTIQLI